MPKLQFSPTAWAKLLFLRDYGDTEVGGFGVSVPDALLEVTDIRLVKQTCSLTHVAFDDISVADFFEDQVEQGHRPEQFARIWIHTHPGDCPLPSSVDEETFERVFGRTDWAVMFILAQGGECYARLRYNHGPYAEFEIPVGIDYSRPFAGTREDDWEAEYVHHVKSREFEELDWYGELDLSSERDLFDAMLADTILEQELSDYEDDDEYESRQ